MEGRKSTWIFIKRTDAEASLLGPPDAKNQFIGKDPDARKDGRQKEKGVTENEMVRWHHWLNRHEFNLSKLQEILKDRGALYAAVHGVAKSLTWLSDWTEQMYDRWIVDDFIILYLCTNRWDSVVSLRSLTQKKRETRKPEDLQFCHKPPYDSSQVTSSFWSSVPSGKCESFTRWSLNIIQI